MDLLLGVFFRDAAQHFLCLQERYIPLEACFWGCVGLMESIMVSGNNISFMDWRNVAGYCAVTIKAIIKSEAILVVYPRFLSYTIETQQCSLHTAVRYNFQHFSTCRGEVRVVLKVILKPVEADRVQVNSPTVPIPSHLIDLTSLPLDSFFSSILLIRIISYIPATHPPKTTIHPGFIILSCMR